MADKPINLKRLRMEVVESRYKKFEIDVPIMLRLIDELIAARETIATNTVGQADGN